MTKREKSSRKKMASRIRRSGGKEPATAVFERETVTGEKIEQKVPNRAQRKLDEAFARRVPSMTHVQQQRQARKNKLTKTRRKLRKIRKEIKKAMRK